MADIPINAAHRRVQYTSAGSAGPYSFSFAILDEGDLAVYDASSLKTLTTHYTVSLNTDGTGSITFTGGNEPTSGNIVTIESNQAIERTADYTTGGDFTAASINSELDRITIVQQQLETIARKSIQLDDFANRDVSSSGAGPLTFPYDDTPADQANKLIGFGAAGTTLVAVDSVALPSSLSGKTLNMLRVNAGETAYEFRTPAQVATDIGAITASSTNTLTNKTIDLDSNTITGTSAEFNTALQGDSFVTLTGSETLTNKTLTSPVLNTSVSGTAVLDEDNMASNSSTQLATQQSIKAYVDALVSANGGNWKASVKVASTANLTLSGEQTIDGVLTSASRILVKDQSSGAENGVYVTAAGAWSRAADADTWDELVSAAVFIEEGTTNADTSYICTSNTGGTLESTTVTWTQFGVTGVTADSTDTFTNKTFDANGTGNSLSNVDVADLANGTDGELITWDAAGAPATVGAGTAAQVLTSNGAGAAPTFQDAAGGGWEFVSAVTASSDPTVAFTNMVSGSDYLYVIKDLLPATDGQVLRARIGISGPTYRTSGYEGSTARIAQSGTSVSSGAITTYIDMQGNDGSGSAADEGNRAGELTLVDPANSGTDTTWIVGTGQYSDVSGDEGCIVGGGGKYTTAAEANVAVQFLYASGNIASGIIFQYKRANS